MTSDAEINEGRVEFARRKLAVNVFAVDAWLTLLKEYQKVSIDVSEPFFEELIAQFPTSVRFWKLYIEREFQAQNYSHIEKLFARCLSKVAHVDLWRMYLSYMKEIRYQCSATDRNLIQQAFEYALEKIGMDAMSAPIWTDYISFLRSVDAIGAYAENQKITAVRKVYHRALMTPLSNIEHIWKDYCSYEMSVNAMLGKKMVEELNRDYMNVRRVSKEYDNVTRCLDRTVLCVPPTRLHEENKQLVLWKKFIAWEVSNPLRTEDLVVIANRVIRAYEQCILCYGYHPDVWYNVVGYVQSAAEALRDAEDIETSNHFMGVVSSLYEKATSQYLKDCILMHFAFANFEENRMNYDQVEDIYEKLLQNANIDPTLCYIEYMRFNRRCRGVAHSRSIFRAARNDSRCKCHVYAAAALLEFYHNKDRDLTRKILDVGLQKYAGDAEYVGFVADFMTRLNDDPVKSRLFFQQSIRSLVDKLTRLTIPDRLSSSNGASTVLERSEEHRNLLSNVIRRLCGDFAEFESNCGTLRQIIDQEQQRNVNLAKVSTLPSMQRQCAMLADRYRFQDLYPCSKRDLKMFAYQTILPSTRKDHLGAGDQVTDEKLYGRYPCPDLNQLQPYRLEFEPDMPLDRDRPHIFPFPPAARNLLKMIPHPSCFNGPMVTLDPFLQLIKDMELPAEFDPAFGEQFLGRRTIDQSKADIPSDDEKVSGAESDEEMTTVKEYH